MWHGERSQMILMKQSLKLIYWTTIELELN